jgi:3-methyladenine DNA glycosylase AlkD
MRNTLPAARPTSPAATEPLVADIAAQIAALPDRRAATVRALRRTLSRSLAHAEPRYVVDAALHLMRASADFAHRFVAYELVASHRGALRSVRAKDLTQFGDGLDSWEDVDTFACYVAGPAWRERQISDALVHRWADSRDRWWRRTALVCTVALNNRARGGRGDPTRTLAICELLVSDRDDMVVKAMSWALRELAKREPKAVRDFVARHDARLAPRVKREVRNKLVTGLKNPRRPALRKGS